MSFKHFTKELNGKGAESEIVKTIFISLITSLFTVGLLYFLKLRYIEGFVSRYGFFLFFAVLSYAVILPSVRHVRAYKNFPCMTGMMIGMTLGMLAGFLIGFFIGATNGMFWGSVAGMTIGIFFGIWNGKCCGVMGVMEGTMAGFMGGLMGAMTSLMTISDHLKATGVIVFGISTAISIGLNYLIFKETRETERQHKDNELFVIIWSFILTILTILMMVFGPRSGLFQ